MLINSVKDVASALGDLIHATKSASGKSINDPAMIYLKDSAKVSYVTLWLHFHKTPHDVSNAPPNDLLLEIVSRPTFAALTFLNNFNEHVDTLTCNFAKI